MSEKVFEIVKENRVCGECKMCCEGWLTGEVYGHKFFPGVKCFFNSTTGCSIYEERPEHPCKSFECAWKQNIVLPEWIRPDRANVILLVLNKDGIIYLKAVDTGEKLDSAVLSYLIDFATNNGINFTWSILGHEYYIGTQEFLTKMKSIP